MIIASGRLSVQDLGKDRSPTRPRPGSGGQVAPPAFFSPLFSLAFSTLVQYTLPRPYLPFPISTPLLDWVRTRYLLPSRAWYGVEECWAWLFFRPFIPAFLPSFHRRLRGFPLPSSTHSISTSTAKNGGSSLGSPLRPWQEAGQNVRKSASRASFHRAGPTRLCRLPMLGHVT